MVGRLLFLAMVFAASAAPAAESTPVCLNAGHQYKVGETACIAACHGKRRLARCDSVGGQASWTFISDACPEVMLPSSPWDTTLRPVATAMTPIPLPIERIMSEMSPDSWSRLADLMRATAGQIR